LGVRCRGTVTQEKDHKGGRDTGPEKPSKTLVGRALLPNSSRPPPRPASQPPRASNRPPAGPASRGRFATPTARRAPSMPSRAPRSQPPPLEEISSSLLLEDDSASGSLPGVEELSGSLLLEDPGGPQLDEPSGLHLDDATVVLPPAPSAPEQQNPPAAAEEERPALAAHRALLGIPELPTATPPPNLADIAPVPVPSSTGTLRPPDPTANSMPSPSSTAVSAALPPDGVPPPPEQMFEALHGFEAAQAEVAHSLEPVHTDQTIAAQPITAASDPIPGDVEMTSLPRGRLVIAIEALKHALEAVKAALRDDSPQRRRWFLPAIAVAGLLVGVGVVVLVVSLVRKGGDESDARTEPSATAPSASEPEKLAAAPTTPAPQPAAPLPAPPTVTEPVVSTTPCKVSGKPRVVAQNAIVSAGVEVRNVGNDVALGFAPNDHQATAVRIDPSSLSLSSTVDAQSTDPVRRVIPLASADGALSIVNDSDRDGDGLQGRRTVALDPPIDIGAAAGKLVWAHHGGGPAGDLWALDGHGNVDALRGAVDPGTNGSPATAIALRVGPAILMGTASGRDTLVPQGPLSRAVGLGDAVGSPAIAINDGVVVVAWADRASTNDPWSMRWVRFKAGEPAGDPGTFTPPAGGKGEQVMSPGLAAVPGGRFLLVWTDGPASRHDVRALTLSHDGVPLGKPLDISNRSANAGQGQAAVNAARQGLVAFLESAEGGFRVVATAVSCGP
jgi:hypothetical protein